MLRSLTYTLLTCSLALLGCKPFVFIGSFEEHQYQHLAKAEEFLRQNEFDKAIEQYLSHIDQRLSLEQRPEWENPHFYRLIIGDIELKRNNVAKALESYEFAEEMKVEKKLISDRFRSVASWHEARGELEKALQVLQKYRQRDPLLFDAMLDRIAKELTEMEDQGLGE